jgi:ketosteroid isomerase-like protein
MLAEDLIRERVDAYARAISSRDIDAVMVFFAPDLLSFDLEPPLRYSTAARKRDRWLEAFSSFTRIDYEVRDLNVVVENDLAFVNGINRFSGIMPNGAISALWVRWTACLRRIGGAWLIVHDHVSVPANLREGKALLGLTP